MSDLLVFYHRLSITEYHAEVNVLIARFPALSQNFSRLGNEYEMTKGAENVI